MNISKYIIVKILGGLGNQMFQYAMGRAFSLRHNCNLKLDITWYSDIKGCTPRKFLLDIFPIKYTQIINKKILSAYYENKLINKTLSFFINPRHYIKETQNKYWEKIEEIPLPSILEGYWQNEKYFLSQRESIIKDFTFPTLHPTSLVIAQKIKRIESSVSIHIRRGDYISDVDTNKFHGTCSSKYYNTAINYIKNHSNNPHLFVFSDDPEWCKKNFNSYGLPSTVVDAHVASEDFHDMHLMSLCKHHIIANSSFSWWGAWLSGEKGIICAPKQWFAALAKKDNNPCPTRWYLIG